MKLTRRVLISMALLVTYWAIPILRAADETAKPVESQPVPKPSIQVALQVSESLSELQQAYIALQATPQQKEYLDKQQAYNEVMTKARESQPGVPGDCFIRKSEWYRQSGPNAFVPCMVPKAKLETPAK